MVLFRESVPSVAAPAHVRGRGTDRRWPGDRRAGFCRAVLGPPRTHRGLAIDLPDGTRARLVPKGWPRRPGDPTFV